MNRPKLLDLFCGAGGAGMGYHRAGFDVYGVDIDPQPDYPFAFREDDALAAMAILAEGGEVRFTHNDGRSEWLSRGDFVAGHGSPPCQAFSPLSALPNAGKKRPPVDLIEPTRRLLLESGLPFVIENVVQAPIASSSDLFGRHGVMLCGTMFGLIVFRHRKFETSFTVDAPVHPKHAFLAMRAGYLPTEARPFMSIHGRGGHNSKAWVTAAAYALEVPWMDGNLDAVCESIPPAYTEHIGAQLLEHIRAEAAA